MRKPICETELEAAREEERPGKADTNRPPGTAVCTPRRSQTHELSWEQLDRQDWQLWFLVTSLIVVLGSGVLSFMFPTVFWFSKELAVAAPQRPFFGLCVMLILVLVYLLRRQATVRRLRRQLFEAQTAIAAGERHALCQAFLALPGNVHFRDALAMEYRRASTSGAPLGALLLNAPSVSLETMGLLASLLRNMLRRNEDLFRISNAALGIMLPGLPPCDLAHFAQRVESLSGLSNEALEVTAVAYPAEVASLAGLERRLFGGSIRPYKDGLGGPHPLAEKDQPKGDHRHPAVLPNPSLG